MTTNNAIQRDDHNTNATLPCLAGSFSLVDAHLQKLAPPRPPQPPSSPATPACASAAAALMVELDKNPIMRSKKRAAHKSCRASTTFVFASKFVFAALYLPRAPSCRCGHGGGFRPTSILEIHDPLSFRPTSWTAMQSRPRAGTRSYFRFDRSIENVTGFNTASDSSRYRSARASLLPAKLHKIDSKLIQTKAVGSFFGLHPGSTEKRPRSPFSPGFAEPPKQGGFWPAEPSAHAQLTSSSLPKVQARCDDICYVQNEARGWVPVCLGVGNYKPGVSKSGLLFSANFHSTLWSPRLI